MRILITGSSGQDGNHTINLAYGQGNSLVAMAEYIGKALGISPTISITPPRMGEVTHYVADISKAHTLLGYEPSTPLHEGIPKAVDWCLGWWAHHESDNASREGG